MKNNLIVKLFLISSHCLRNIKLMYNILQLKNIDYSGEKMRSKSNSNNSQLVQGHHESHALKVQTLETTRKHDLFLISSKKIKIKIWIFYLFNFNYREKIYFKKIGKYTIYNV